MDRELKSAATGQTIRPASGSIGIDNFKAIVELQKQDMKKHKEEKAKREERKKKNDLNKKMWESSFKALKKQSRKVKRQIKASKENRTPTRREPVEEEEEFFREEPLLKIVRVEDSTSCSGETYWYAELP